MIFNLKGGLALVTMIFFFSMVYSCKKLTKNQESHSPKSDATLSEEEIMANDCINQIPHLSLEQVIEEDKKITFFIKDNYESPDWFLYDEIILYAWSKGCFPKSMGIEQDVDSVCFIFIHQEDTAVRVDVPYRYHSFSKLRFDSELYYNFFEKSLRRKEFRADLKLLSHLYGKLVDDNPMDGTVSYKSVLVFLLKVATECKLNVIQGEDNELLQNIFDQLNNHRFVDQLIYDLGNYQPCLND